MHGEVEEQMLDKLQPPLRNIKIMIGTSKLTNSELSAILSLTTAQSMQLMTPELLHNISWSCN